MIDLSLILFLLTAAALTKAGPGTDGPAAEGASAGAPARPPASQIDNASAVYRMGNHAPSFGQWLAEQAPDPRQRLTIYASYRPGEQARVSADALRLLAQAGPASRNARIVLEASDQPQTLAVLSYDLGETQLARSLPVASKEPPLERGHGGEP